MAKFAPLLCWLATVAAALTLVAAPAWAADPPTAAAPTASVAPAVPATPATPAAPAAAKAPDQVKVEVSTATAAEAHQMVCRNVKMTGSNVRTRRVCSTPASESRAEDLLRQQQDRGGLNASAILNSGT